LRSFVIEEGKSLIAMPDGTNNFICYLSNVAEIAVRRNVTVSYRYTL